MDILKKVYEGKAKEIYNTTEENFFILKYKDEATAFDGEKKSIIKGKGAINNKITNYFMKILEQNNIPTQFIKELSSTTTLVKKLDIIPLEIIVRNIATGSFCKRYNTKEGKVFEKPCLEFCLKNDILKDPFISYHSILALDITTEQNIKKIEEYSFKINDILKNHLIDFNIILVDFKLEFGIEKNKNLILADEISPDTCRFWDKITKERLDKDRFRKEMQDISYGYNEIFKRLIKHKNT